MEHRRAVTTLHWLAATLLTASVALAVDTSAAPSTTVSENVPVPGGIAALARALEITAPDRARCVSEIVRVVYGDSQLQQPDVLYRRMVTHFSGVGSAAVTRDREPDLVPVPLTASVWSRAIFRREVRPHTLFAAILSDRKAALLAHGLSALDDETLQFFVDHPALLTALYLRGASVFASFTAHLQIHDNRVVTPGGNAGVMLWEAALNARVTDPVAFVTALFTSANGRLAYLYDVIAHLDEPRVAFALGFDGAMRVERFRALAKVTSSIAGEWNATRVPFSRPAFDLLALLQRVQVERSGAPRFPVSKRLWTMALSGTGDRMHDTRPLSEDRPIDAAWLAEVVLGSDGGVRRDRLDQLGFGYRVFGSAQGGDPSDLIEAIGSFPRVPMLMLTLERVGIRRAAVYTALARHAERLTSLDAIQEHRALAQFQGAIAVVTRMVRVSTIDHATAEQLLHALASLPIDTERGYMGAVASWLERDVRPAIARSAEVTFEYAMVQALAGRPGAPTEPVSWEGHTYVFDLPTSEAARLRRFRERRSLSSLDETIEIHRVVRRLAAGEVGRAEVDDTLNQVRAALARLPSTTTVSQPLTQLSARTQDAAAVLLESVDVLTADALMSFAYAIDWSDPQGPARLDRDLSRRHDFGLTALSRVVRARTAWALPRLSHRPGEPWRVQGAALGLDAALASLALRTIALTPPSQEPQVLTTIRESFVVSLGLLNVFDLRDADIDAMAGAVRQGQQRIDALRIAGADVTAVIDEIRMDGWRARAVRWSLVHEPARVAALFSLTELLHLGGGAQLAVHAWGMSALNTLGCLCTHLPPPGLQTALVSRHHVGLLPATVPDLNLRVALVLRELRLPAALAKGVLEAALYDLLVEVSPMHFDDWLAFVRRARTVSPERIEDYLAALTASAGPLSSLPSGRRLP